MAQSPVPSVLHFDMDEFAKTDPRQSTHKRGLLFLEFVKQELLRRPPHIPIEEFALDQFQNSNTELMRSSLDTLVRLLAVTKAKLLWFNIFNDEESYKFPFSEIFNSSVEVLVLFGCDLDIPRTSLTPQLNSIKEMQLNDFHCGGDRNIEHLVASCVNLETLTINQGYDLKSFKITLPKLKHFALHCDIDEDEISVEICAPTLESMEFCVGSGGKFAITDTSSLVRATVDFHSRSWRNFTLWTNVLSFITGVERLAIQNMWTWFLGEPTAKNSAKEYEPQGESHAEAVDDDSKESREDEDLEDFDGEFKLGAAVMSETLAFRNLKHLELLTGYLKDDVLGLEVMLKKCPQLVTLTLVYKYKSALDEQPGNEIEDRPVDLNLPHLQQIEMKDYRESMNEQKVAMFLKKHCPVLERIVACPPEIYGNSSPPLILWSINNVSQ